MKDLKLESLWGYKLRELVESIYMPQFMYNSLPFVIQKDNEYRIRWFYYDLKRIGDECYLYIRRIVTLDDTGRCYIVPNQLISTKWNLKISDVEPPQLDFYEEFLENYKKGNYQKILDLLVEFESVESIALYDELFHIYL